MRRCSRSTLRRVALGLGALLALGAGGCGSTGGDDGPAVGELLELSDDVRVDLPGRVSLLVQVLDPRGRPVPGLGSEDFRLFENDVEISPTEAQQQLLPRPKVYGLLSFLLLDLSSSISSDPDVLAAEVAAARAYIDLVTEDPAQRVALAFFFGADDIVPATALDPVSGAFEPIGFTADAELLHAALDGVDRIEVVDDSTNLYGAVIQAAAALADEDFRLSEEGEVEFVSRALVTFTDGSHNANDLTAEEAAAALADVDSFTIGVGDETDRDALELLGSSGFVVARSLSRLSDSFREVGARLADQANSFYRIGYISPKNSGSADPLLRVEAVDGGRDALLETTFSTRYFSGGAGFVAPLAAGVADRAPGACVDLAVDAAGRAVVLARLVESPGLALGRYTADGAPDPDFGLRGIATLPPELAGEGESLAPAALALGPEGALHVVALRTASNTLETHLVVLRVGDEVERVDLPARLSGDPVLADAAHDLEVDADGRVWIGGESHGPTGARRLIVRLTDELALDPAFGAGGVVSHVAEPSVPTDYVADLVLDEAAGRVLAVGGGYHPERGAADDLQVVAFDDAGAVDADWADGGIVRNWAVFEGNAFYGLGPGRAAALDTEGRLWIAGATQLPGAEGAPVEVPTVWRLDATGAPDPDFRGGLANPYGPGQPLAAPGLVSLGTPFTGNAEILFGRSGWLDALAFEPDGAVLVAGGRENAESHSDAAWLRLDEAGLLDARFNGTGFFLEDGPLFDDGDETLFAVARGADGALWSCGSSTAPGSLSERLLVFRDDDPRRAVPED